MRTLPAAGCGLMPRAGVFLLQPLWGMNKTVNSISRPDYSEARKYRGTGLPGTLAELLALHL